MDTFKHHVLNWDHDVNPTPVNDFEASLGNLLKRRGFSVTGVKANKTETGYTIAVAYESWSFPINSSFGGLSSKSVVQASLDTVGSYTNEPVYLYRPVAGYLCYVGLTMEEMQATLPYLKY